MIGLKGKTVLVTGESSGIGQATAVRFAQEGANVAINYRKSGENAKETEARVKQVCSRVRECGVNDLLVQADVSRNADVVRMFDTVVKEFSELHILINNAGIQMAGASHEVKIDDVDRVIAVNLRGAYLCAREAVRHFLYRDEGGVIINISSVHEIIPKPEYLSYSISKGGIRNITRTLALEYADRGIRVNAVAPGATITPINITWISDPKRKAEVESHIPL